MPQKLHDAWGGYERLVKLGPDKKKIKGSKARAKCKICGHTMHNITRVSLSTHTKLCQGVQGEEEEDDSGSTATSQRMYSSSSQDLSDNQPALNAEDSNSSFSPKRSSVQAMPPKLVGVQERMSLPSLPSTSRDCREPVGVMKSKAASAKRRKKSDSSNGSGTSHSLEIDDDDDDLLSHDSSMSRSATSTPINVARKNKQAGLKRKTISESSNYEAIDEKKAIAVYKYYLVSNIDLDNIKLLATNELFTTLDPNFTLSTVEELRTTIAEKAAEKVYQANHAKRHTQVLQILTRVVPGKIDDGEGNLKDWNKVQALSLLRSSTGDWTYVKNYEFLADPIADSSSSIQKFCDESVLEAKSSYNVDVLFLLHSGEYKLNEVCSVKLTDKETIQYYTICEITTALKNLHCDLISNMNNHSQVNTYYDTLLNKIFADIFANNPSMAVTMQRLFEAIDLLDDVNQSIISDKLAKIISPLHLAAKVFHPQFHTSFIDKEVHKSLLTLFQDFQQHTAPRLLADSVSYYIEKTGSCFTRFYREKRESNPTNFWNASKLDPYLSNIKLLANYALQLLALPSTLTDIILKEAFSKLDKQAVRTDDFDRVLFTYLLQ